jgi:phosphatidylserine/phosphatidylglycerophosphate/cardiolipin synthase-like enzyme
MSLPRELLEQIHDLAQEIPAQTAQALIAAIMACPANHWEETKRRTQGVTAHPRYRQKVGVLVDSWAARAPHVEPSSLALALETAAFCVDAGRRSETLELVWTGPQSDTALRRTDQALLQVIESARSQLLIVSFAVYSIPDIRAALVQVLERGVQLTIVIESPRESDGKVAYDGLIALGKDVAKRARIVRWPLEKRRILPDGKRGALHVKCAIADDRVLLVSSANLTEYALTLNMEMGLLVTGGVIPQQVAQHFRELIEQGTLLATE